MPNYKKTQSQLELVETYESTTTITSKTFTLSPTDDFTNTSYYILMIDYQQTAALDLRMGLNGLTANYYSDGRRIAGGVETLLGVDAAAISIISSATHVGGNNEYSGVNILISYNKDAGVSKLAWQSSAFKAGSSEIQAHGIAADAAGLISIEITVSTSSLKTGARMTLYKVNR